MKKGKQRKANKEAVTAEKTTSKNTFLFFRTSLAGKKSCSQCIFTYILVYCLETQGHTQIKADEEKFVAFWFYFFFEGLLW